MKKSILIISFFLQSITWCFSQNHIGIGTSLPDTNAILDLQTTSKGILIPRLSSLQRNNMSPSLGQNQTGLMVFDLDSVKFFYWNGVIWQTFGSGTMGPIGPTGPSCGNTILHTNLKDTTSSATSAVQILREWTLPANTLINNGSYLEIEVFGTISNQTQYPMLQISIGPLVVGNLYPLNNGTGTHFFSLKSKIYRVSGTLIKSLTSGFDYTSLPYTNVLTGAVNLSIDQPIIFIAKDQVAGANSIVVNGFIIRKVE